MKKLISVILGLMVVSMFIFAAGCAPLEDEITLGYVSWAEAIAMTHMAQAIIEDDLGYNVETIMADVAPTFQALETGDVDVFMDVWLPVTHEEYLDQFGDNINEVGLNFTGARIGLVVPEYVDIDSIEELNDYSDQFNNEIIGIDPGAGIMDATRDAIEEYDLDFNLVEGSGPAMTASLSDAIDNDQWIAVTGWEPHWKFAEWDLKFLEDPEGLYGEEENIYTYSRENLKEDAPEVYSFLQNFEMTSEELGDLMAAFEENDRDNLEIGREWVEENRELVDSWLE